MARGEVSIVAAAIRLDGVVYSVPRPGRHDNVIHKIWEATKQTVPGSAEQGFLTSDGEFVNRWQALRIAHAAGQPCSRPLSLRAELYSEDVW